MDRQQLEAVPGMVAQVNERQHASLAKGLLPLHMQPVKQTIKW